MSGFMPSEVARLVLGYLKEAKCEKSVGMFLNESPHLYEYVECLLKGREYSTSINGYSLLDILNDFESSVHSQPPDDRSKSRVPTESRLSTCARDLLLAARNQHKPVRLVSVGCGNDEVCSRKHIGCQTSPMLPEINHSSLAHVNVNRATEELPQIQKPDHRTPVKPTLTSFTTPCRPLDFYSSPASLVKSFKDFQDVQVTPVKSREGDVHDVSRLINSPRRKDFLPRKRLYSPRNSSSMSPSPSGKKRLIENYDSGSSCFSSPSVDSENAVSTSGCNVEKALIENMLQNSPLQEIIATHINEMPLTAAASSDEQLTNNIRTIANHIEADPTFDCYLKSICVEEQGDSSVESQVTPTVATELESGNAYCQEKTVGVRINDANCNWSTSTATHSLSTAIIDGTTMYLLPMGMTCDNASATQLVNISVSSSDEICQVNPSQVQIQSAAVGPSVHTQNDRQFSTLSPSQLSTIDVGEKQARQKVMLRNRQTHSSESLKQNLARRQYAVKSLNFKNNVSVIDHTKLRSVLQKNQMGPRLKSLINTVGAQNNQPDDQLTQNKNNPNKVPEVTKENTLKIQQAAKKVNPNKSSTNKKSAKTKSKTSTGEADLDNINIDKILSNVQYVE